MNTATTTLFALASLVAVTAATRPAAAQQDPLAEAKAARVPDDPLGEGKDLLAQEDWRAAATAFLKVLRKQPEAEQAPEARFWAGYCQVKSEEHEQAIQTLLPFQESLAADKWADDALNQLGYAYQGVGESEQAIATWKRMLANHADSVWNTEVMLNVVNLLFERGDDFKSCLTYCERLLAGASDPSQLWDTRYVGAYSLNALGRYDEAEQWVEKWFDPTSALQEAWRTLLVAQRHLLRGEMDAALAAIDSLERDFDDLERGDWLDVLTRTSKLLRRHDQAARARPLLLRAVPRLAGHAAHEVAWVLDELAAAVGDTESLFIEELARLAADAGTPPVVRALVRERQVAELRGKGRAQEAADVLRAAISQEREAFPRFRAALLLTEVLANDLGDRAGAVKVLEDVLPTLDRRDFARQVREKLAEYRAADGG